MLNYCWFLLAALFEIAGCYAFYLWLRLDKSAWWAVAGLLSLTCFALVLTRVEAAYAGRAYAAYGGLYIVASLGWLAVVEKGASADVRLDGRIAVRAGREPYPVGTKIATGLDLSRV